MPTWRLHDFFHFARLFSLQFTACNSPPSLLSQQCSSSEINFVLHAFLTPQLVSLVFGRLYCLYSLTTFSYPPLFDTGSTFLFYFTSFPSLHHYFQPSSNYKWQPTLLSEKPTSYQHIVLPSFLSNVFRNNSFDNNREVVSSFCWFLCNFCLCKILKITMLISIITL